MRHLVIHFHLVCVFFLKKNIQIWRRELEYYSNRFNIAIETNIIDMFKIIYGEIFEMESSSYLILSGREKGRDHARFTWCNKIIAQ